MVPDRNNWFLSVFLLIGFGLLLVVALSVLDGELTRSDLMNLIGSGVGAISLAATFALGVLAINAFSNAREIESRKLEIQAMREDLQHQLENVETAISILPVVIGTIARNMPEAAANSDYLKLLHARLFVKLLTTDNPVDRIGICRDIIGSSSTETDRRIIERCLADLKMVEVNSPSERQIILELSNAAEDILSDIRKAKWASAST